MICPVYLETSLFFRPATHLPVRPTRRGEAPLSDYSCKVAQHLSITLGSHSWRGLE